MSWRQSSPMLNQVLDELNYTGPEAPWDNLTGILMALENADNADELISQLLEHLIPVLRSYGSPNLQKAFEQFINHSVKTAPNQPIRLDDLEDTTMLRENATRWRKEWVNQGRIEGRLEGKLEGEQRLLTRLLSRRFGELPFWVTRQLEQASEAELEHWGEELLDANSLEQLFEHR